MNYLLPKGMENVIGDFRKSQHSSLYLPKGSKVKKQILDFELV